MTIVLSKRIGLVYPLMTTPAAVCSVADRLPLRTGESLLQASKRLNGGMIHFPVLTMGRPNGNGSCSDMTELRRQKEW